MQTTRNLMQLVPSPTGNSTEDMPTFGVGYLCFSWA